MIYGRAVVGGYGKFMKLNLRFKQHLYCNVNAFCFREHNKQLKEYKKNWWWSNSFLSSTGNLVYIENYAGHGTNKAAVEAMVRYAANELGEFNIRVNAVSGGPIDKMH